MNIFEDVVASVSSKDSDVNKNASVRYYLKTVVRKNTDRCGDNLKRIPTLRGKKNFCNTCRPCQQIAWTLDWNHISVRHLTGTFCSQLTAKVTRPRRCCAWFSTILLEQPTSVALLVSSVLTLPLRLMSLITESLSSGSRKSLASLTLTETGSCLTWQDVQLQFVSAHRHHLLQAFLTAYPKDRSSGHFCIPCFTLLR